jgi:phage I-like protein
MKKILNTKFKQTTLAVLSASNECTQNIAILGAELITSQNGLVQLLPAGKFNAVDGRPADVADNHWLMDKTAFESLKANTPHKQGDLVIDYEHQTLKSPENGQPAIASGFFNIDDLVFLEDQGLFIKPKWTDKAQAHLSAGEYKYISAVFGYDPITGRPSYLHSAALVNRPGVDGMKPLTQLAANMYLQNSNSNNQYNQEDTAVNPLLLAILQALGIKADGDLPTEPAALNALENQVTTALAALQADAGKVPELNNQITALSASRNAGEQVDPSKYVPIAAITELQTTVAALQAQVSGGQVDTLVKQGIEDGRIIASMENWARELGNQSIAQLQAYLNTSAPIAALSGKQTVNLNLDVDGNKLMGVAALSAEDKDAAIALGISLEDFAAQKDAELGDK